MSKSTGKIIRYEKELDQVIDSSATAEVLAEGFTWSEGPLWIEQQQMLLFSDVPKNTVYKWTESTGTEVYLSPSGYTGETPSKSREPGSNGLTLDAAGRLVLCQHGDRQMGRMDAALDQPSAVFTKLADKYNDRRFSSPNDCVYHSNGELYFTDPPYGLPSQNDNDPTKEIPFNGVYKVKKDGSVILLVDSITRPNGLAFFPGEKQLLIANSDPAKPVWYIYSVEGDKLVNGEIFFDAGINKKWRGLPDGLKINRQGIVFATGPGGVYIFNQTGKLLGLLQLEKASSNCALSADEKTLYITNHQWVIRIRLK